MISGSDGELGGCQLSLARINQMPLAELSGAFCAKTWQIRMIAAAAGWGGGGGGVGGRRNTPPPCVTTACKR